MKAACAALLVCAGCAATSAERPAVRFADRPVVWVVDDRADIPRPSKRVYLKDTDYYDQVALHQVTRWLALPDRHPAGDINAVDEVPDSTWFTNRIGRRELSPAEIERGPAIGHDPMEFKPWTVVSSKVGGTEVGFIIEDRAGVRYVLKFDSPGFPEQETGAHLVVSRVLWACGYRVPDDRLVHFLPSELILGPKSVVVDEFGHSRPMTAADLAKGLAGVDRQPGKPIRALTSRFVPGKVVGGFSPTGRRSDDANDRVPHQDRRELRGLEPIVAWLGHTDIKEGNTIDTWVADPGDPRVHYLVHYLIDFGKALGNMAEIGRNVRSGFAYRFDWGYALRSFFTLGLYPNQWDRLRAPKLRGVGLFESQSYDPSTYVPNQPFAPFFAMDRADGFWGAKLIMRFSPADVRATVDAGGFTDPRAVDYLVRTLIARQRKTARYWFGRITPADQPVAETTPSGVRVCFSDLMRRYALDDGRPLVYQVGARDFDGRPLPVSGRPQAGAGGRVCSPSIAPPRSHGGYFILSIRKRVGGDTLPPVRVHVGGSPARVLGIERSRWH